MPLPFDATLKELVRRYPLDWLSGLRLRPTSRPWTEGFNTTRRAALAGIDFRFEVVRIWERPASALLRGGLGMAPLAPLGELRPDSPEAALPRVLGGPR